MRRIRNAKQSRLNETTGYSTGDISKSISNIDRKHNFMFECWNGMRIVDLFGQHKFKALHVFDIASVCACLCICSCINYNLLRQSQCKITMATRNKLNNHYFCMSLKFHHALKSGLRGMFLMLAQHNTAAMLIGWRCITFDWSLTGNKSCYIRFSDINIETASQPTHKTDTETTIRFTLFTHSGRSLHRIESSHTITFVWIVINSLV